ncbi:hypothetical protein PAMP_015283 [Pampus punctatissimus]
MTVRFKSRSEYQKSYRVSRSRSVSPQCCAPLAGLRSDQMGISREPGLQRRKRLSPADAAQSCSFLLRPPDPHRTAPPAASRSCSAHRNEPSPDPKPPTPAPGSHAEPASPADPEPPVGPRPAADPEPPSEPRTTGKSTKPHPSKHDSQPQLRSPVTSAPDGRQPLTNEHALRWRAGLRSGGQRSESHRTEYNKQFSWKKPATAASPVLTAEQVLHSRSVPPFKKNLVSMETEYQQNFRGLIPPTGPRLRKHLEHQRVPLFHTHMSNKKRREKPDMMPRPKLATPRPQRENIMLSPTLVERGHRCVVKSSKCLFVPGQVKELRQKALSYRRRAWGANFSRDHLSQLLSEHNALWEPTDTTDSATDPPTPRLTFNPGHNSDSHSTSCVEALDLASRSSSCSKRSSVVVSGDIQQTSKNTQTNAQTPSSPAVDRSLTWRKEEEEENTDEEEGRLPTPRLKMRPVQRTHHDVTTPATGGAILVGKLKSSDEASPFKPQRCGTAVTTATGADTTVDLPVARKEAWPDNSTCLYSSNPAPNHKPASSSPSKPIRTKPSSPVAPPPHHCIQGTLRHPEFQHNGELGLRFRELQCPGGGCASDEDDRLSVMSWRSAASCSMASAVLERAQERRENFWGKR